MTKIIYCIWCRHNWVIADNPISGTVAARCKQNDSKESNQYWNIKLNSKTKPLPIWHISKSHISTYQKTPHILNPESYRKYEPSLPEKKTAFNTNDWSSLRQIQLLRHAHHLTPTHRETHPLPSTKKKTTIKRKPNKIKTNHTQCSKPEECKTKGWAHTQAQHGASKDPRKWTKTLSGTMAINKQYHLLH